MQRRALIFEDEPAIADAILYAFNGEGYDTAHAALAGRGLSLLETERFDLVILDLGLPDQNGFDVLREIRRRDELMPVIILSARAGEVDRVLGLELGADDYMTKPFSPRELTARARALLRRIEKIASVQAESPAPVSAFPASGAALSAAGGAAVVRTPAGRFELSEEKTQIRYCGQALQLSRYEYRLLALLVRHPGWIFSRDRILDLVWDETADSFDRTVDAHIKTLRAKLRAVDDSIDPILTHRGLGYALREDL